MMTGTSCVAAAARLVRGVTATAVVAMVIGVVAISSFAARYGDDPQTTVAAASSDPVLVAAVRVQESAGLRCSVRPGLADIVLFQRTGASSVTALKFDAAIRAVAAHEGVVRGYCA